MNTEAIATAGDPKKAYEAQLQCFDEYRTRHPRIVDAIKEIKTVAHPTSGIPIINLIGPTGVGKSAAAELIENIMTEEAFQDELANPGCIPVIRINAPANGESDFSWRHFYLSILAALGEPLVDKKQGLFVAADTGRMTRIGGRASNLASLRTAVEQALRERGVKVMVVDESAHMLHLTQQRNLLKNLDALKSLVNSAGATLVFIGAYDLLPLVTLSGQLARRTKVIHFGRYHVDNVDDVDVFNRVLADLQKQLPQSLVPDLTAYAMLLMEYSLGCVGRLKNILALATRYAIAQGHWSEACLNYAFQGEAQERVMLAETLAGERDIADKVSYGSAAKWGDKQ